MGLLTDSREYGILVNAVEAAAHLDPKALSCEIGLREGGGTKHMIDAMWQSGQYGRTHIAIDPYGNIEYKSAEGLVTRHDYTNTMRNRCMMELHEYLHTQYNDQINVLVFVLEDAEFFKRYADGVPIYWHSKRIANQYAVVHFDGPHAHAPLVEGVEFFTPRLVQGAHVVFDDIANYDHDKLERKLFEMGYSPVDKGAYKASYKYR